MRLLKDVPLASDQLVTSYVVNCQGSTTSQSYQFMPTEYGSYHLDLQLGSVTVWSQPNDSSRLKVSQPLTAVFSVGSYGFSRNPTIVGQSVGASVSFSGGVPGTYNLRLLRDVTFAPDQLVAENSIVYNGTSASQSCVFTPDGAGTYHMDIQLNGNTVWSQPNDSSRLMVSSPQTTTPLFSVISYGFSPSVASVGQSVGVSVTLSGGRSGNYTLRLLRD